MPYRYVCGSRAPCAHGAACTRASALQRRLAGAALRLWGCALIRSALRPLRCTQSTAALPFGTIVIIVLIWCLVTIPLTVFGGIAGKNNK